MSLFKTRSKYQYNNRKRTKFIWHQIFYELVDTFAVWESDIQTWIRSDEGLTLQTSAFESLYGG